MAIRFYLALGVSVTIHAVALIPVGSYFSEKETVPACIAFSDGESAMELTLLPSPAARAASVSVPSPATAIPKDKPESRIVNPPVQKMMPVVRDATTADFSSFSQENPERVAVRISFAEVFQRSAALSEHAPDSMKPPAAVLSVVASQDGADVTNAVAQDADIRRKGVKATAQTLYLAKPVYPPLSRKRGEEGTVVLSIEICADGALGVVAVLRSSGYARLDGAAVASLRNARLSAAQLDGRAIASTIRRAFVFRLVDDVW